MEPLANALQQYLEEATGERVSVAPWKEGGKLPLYLQQRYEFLTATALDRQCLFVADDDQRLQVAAVAKQLAQVQTRWQGPVAYLRTAMTAYQRRRLLQQRIPFVVPGTQMYLPSLGVDLREQFREPVVAPAQLRPSAQAVLIHELLPYTQRGLPAAQLAPRLGFTPMTVGRAFDEIAAAGLATTRRRHRERLLQLAAPSRDLWERAQPVLQDPVQARNWVRLREPQDELCAAGLTALAELSSLAQPAMATLATGSRTYRRLLAQQVAQQVPEEEPDAVQLEIWRYPPEPLSQDRRVDPLSLCLSLRRDTSERVQAALEDLLGALPW